MSITDQRVARAAGVLPGMVRRSLNRPPGVSSEKIQRVCRDVARAEPLVP